MEVIPISVLLYASLHIEVARTRSSSRAIYRVVITKARDDAQYLRHLCLTLVQPFGFAQGFGSGLRFARLVLLCAREEIVKWHAEAVQGPRDQVVLADREHQIHHLLRVVGL